MKRRGFVGLLLAGPLAWFGLRLGIAPAPAAPESLREVAPEDAACDHRRQTCVSMEIPGFDPNRRNALVFVPCAETGCPEARGLPDCDNVRFCAMVDDPFTGGEIEGRPLHVVREGQPGSMQWVPIGVTSEVVLMDHA